MSEYRLGSIPAGGYVAIPSCPDGSLEGRVEDLIAANSPRLTVGQDYRRRSGPRLLSLSLLLMAVIVWFVGETRKRVGL